MTCSSCGATSRPGAAWCGQCHASFEAGSTTAPAPVLTRPMARPAPPPVEEVYSRWRAGPTSMGPFGRLAWTLGVLLVAVLSLFSTNPVSIGIWCLVVGPLILRSVWKKHRIR